ncbi:MFS family permease [Saccharopolyspora gloriosae]|uniref:MFS family permease n=1 Tax=Saccharopolyspora gloriosae TaxID=455344 RepID=A0A840NEW9_9PSEU|nr:MFS family permease [Saccharopolyspora gloriosae]
MSTTTVRGTPTRAAQVTVLGAAGLTIMSAALIAPSLPAMAVAFAGADVLVRLALTITSLAIAISAPLSGAVADRLGRRPLLVGALALYAVAGTAGYFATGLGLLLVTRMLLGVAVGGLLTAISALITDWFDGRRRAAFLGRQQAAASLGGVVFLPLAGVLSAVDWRLPFWLYAAGALVLPLAWRTIEGTRRSSAPPAAGRERNGRRIGGIYLLALVATLVFYMAPTQLPFLLAGFHLGPAVTGAVVACSTLTGAVGALAFPALRAGPAPRVLTAGSIALLGLGWVVIGTAGSAVPIVFGLLVGGVGVGLVVPDLNLRLAELATPARRGRVLSGLVTGIFLGQFLSPLAAQPLIEVAGISGAFTWTGAALTAAALTATTWHRNEREAR